MVQGLVSVLTNVLINYGVVEQVAFKGKLAETITDAAVTLTIEQVGKCLFMNGAAAQAITLDNAIFKIGDEVEVWQIGANPVTFVAGVGTSAIAGLTGPGGQAERVIVKKVADGTFNVAI